MSDRGTSDTVASAVEPRSGLILLFSPHYWTDLCDRMPPMESQPDLAALLVACWDAQLKAMDEGDTAGLRECFTSEMTLTHLTGQVQPLEQCLAGINRGDFVYHRIERRSVEVIASDLTSARLRGRVITGITEDGSGQAWPLRVEQDYVLTELGWRCHASRVTLDSR